MNSTPTPKVETHDSLMASAEEQLAHAHEQIARADEDLARLSEQLAKMEQGAVRSPSAESGPPSAEPGPQSPPGKPVLRALVGLPLAACVIVAVLVLQSSYGDGAKLVVARWAPQLVSSPSLPPENATLPPQPAPPVVQVAAAEAASPQGTPLAQAAPQDNAPTSTAAASCRSGTTAANDCARSRECGAQHRTAQGEPAANVQRQFKSH